MCLDTKHKVTRTKRLLGLAVRSWSNSSKAASQFQRAPAQKAEESKVILIEDKEAKRKREQEKHDNYIAWLNKESDRRNDERMGVGYSKFYAQWINDHNGDGDGLEDAWKQTEAYKAKQEEKTATA